VLSVNCTASARISDADTIPHLHAAEMPLGMAVALADYNDWQCGHDELCHCRGMGDIASWWSVGRKNGHRFLPCSSLSLVTSAIKSAPATISGISLLFQ
jgi:hypothetical protein